MKSLFLFLLLLPAFVSGQVIETIAGNGTAGYSGDGMPAISCEFGYPECIVFDSYQNMYIADVDNNVIRKINTSGIVSTFAGNGSAGYSGDGGPATIAQLSGPSGIGVDDSDNIYIADNSNSVIRKVNSLGIITTIAGNGIAGFSGDNAPATAANFLYPYAVALDHSHNIYISDIGNNRVRKINTLGIITTFAGTGVAGYSGDGGLADMAKIEIAGYLAISSSGDLYIPDYPNQRIRKVSSLGIIQTVAGNGIPGYYGDGGPATNAKLYAPNGIAFDELGNFFIADVNNYVIRKVDVFGIISTVVGNGIPGYSGDGGAATAAQINKANCAVDAAGNLYLADAINNRIRRIVYSKTALNDINKAINNISIYPNPAQNEVTIKCITAIESVEVVNMMGQVVASPRPSPKEREVLLDIQSLPAGVYFVKVNGVYGGEFVKE